MCPHTPRGVNWRPEWDSNTQTHTHTSCSNLNGSEWRKLDCTVDVRDGRPATKHTRGGVFRLVFLQPRSYQIVSTVHDHAQCRPHSQIPPQHSLPTTEDRSLLKVVSPFWLATSSSSLKRHVCTHEFLLLTNDILCPTLDRQPVPNKEPDLAIITSVALRQKKNTTNDNLSCTSASALATCPPFRISTTESESTEGKSSQVPPHLSCPSAIVPTSALPFLRPFASHYFCPTALLLPSAASRPRLLASASLTLCHYTLAPCQTARRSWPFPSACALQAVPSIPTVNE